MSNRSDETNFQLAVMRTELSNSTTLLSHIQASIGLLLSGVAFMKLLDSFIFFDFCGWFFIVLSFGTFARGVFLYRQTKNRIENEKLFFNRSEN